LNHDNYLDVVVVNGDTENIGIFLGYGNGTFGTHTMYSICVGSQPSATAIAAGSDTDCVLVLLGKGDGTFINQTNYSIGPSGTQLSVSVADFNHDHYLDIVITNEKYSNIGIFLGYGNGTFATQIKYSTGLNSFPESIAIGDMNNDNHLDIVVANSNTKNVGIFLGYGNGSFTNQKTYSISLSSTSDVQSFAISDFNNDK
jgi:hypothetical protein